MPNRLVPGLLLAFLSLAAPRAHALDQAAAVNFSRQYLASEDRTERRALRTQLADYHGDIDAVVHALADRPHAAVKPGYHRAEHFQSAEFLTKHPDDLLYFVVPENYRPERPTGLIVFLHGGGRSTSPYAPSSTLSFPDKDSVPYSSPSGDMFASTGMITVGPSAPKNPKTAIRWCQPYIDEYIADVILECKNRFNIDPDRVLLIGHSMGGFGAYHFALRHPDRFATIIISSGSWSLGYWPVIRGTPLCIVQAKHDAVPHVRWHYTDVEYGRLTDKILSREKLEHVYLEHDLHHSFGYGRPYVAKYLASAPTLRRDPYYPHVTLASPEGFMSFCSAAVEHNRWLTLDEATRGQLTYDELVTTGEDRFDTWRLHHRQSERRGAMIDAVNRGSNTIAVTTRNVARFTLWLHPRMVDPSRPVAVTVDGTLRFNGMVKPALSVALKSYERKRDWGMIYPMKVEIDLRQATGAARVGGQRWQRGFGPGAVSRVLSALSNREAVRYHSPGSRSASWVGNPVNFGYPKGV